MPIITEHEQVISKLVNKTKIQHTLNAKIKPISKHISSCSVWILKKTVIEQVIQIARTHARAHARTHTHTHTPEGSASQNRWRWSSVGLGQKTSGMDSTVYMRVCTGPNNPTTHHL